MDSPGVRLQVYTAILLENPDGPLPRRAVRGVSFRWDPESIDIEVPRQEQASRTAERTQQREAAAPPFCTGMYGHLRILEENELTWSTGATFSENPRHGNGLRVKFEDVDMRFVIPGVANRYPPSPPSFWLKL